MGCGPSRHTLGPPSGQSAGPTTNQGFCDRTRSARRRMYEIQRMTTRQRHEQQTHAYRVLIDIAEEVVGNARAGLERTRTQIAHATDLAVVPAHLDPTTAPARRFFERRRSVITRAFGSPKIPRTVGCARKPANEYVSHSRRRRLDARAIRNSCQISHPSKCRIPPQSPLFSHFHLKNHPLDSTL